MIYKCHYCDRATKDVSYRTLPGDYIMKCACCNVTYKFRFGILRVVNIRVDYKGDRYYYKLFNDRMVLMKFNPGFSSENFTKIYEFKSPDKITPVNALKKLPLFLTFT